jgi:hypothetical protein
MPKPIHKPLFILSIALLAGLLLKIIANPGLALAAVPSGVAYQSGGLQGTRYPLQEGTPTPDPYPMDERPVERNPFLIAGGVLIFLVIIFGVWKYSRAPEGIKPDRF